ncbi:MAG: D-alanine--D-alanine ligase [bacterium]|nr:D-alanine--D-alanine ligase [bacterium]
MIRVGVLRGGPSEEHEVSLKTGESALSAFAEKHSVNDIVLGKNGGWYLNGHPAYPERIFQSVDVVFNALHGTFGEDGKVQQILETYKIPYTGSGILSSAIGMNKVLSREAFAAAGLLTPRAAASAADESPAEFARRVLRTTAPPWVVKPASSGSSVGVSIVQDFHGLIGAIEAALTYGPRVIAEEFIEGREATCGIVENFRGSGRYALPVVEIIPPENSDFFDYGAKYGGMTNELCPAKFDGSVKARIEDMAREAHRAVGCRHYSRADFIVSKRRAAGGEPKIYILEINTLPGMTKESLLPKAIDAVGVSYPDFLNHLINLALRGNKL